MNEPGDRDRQAAAARGSGDADRAASPRRSGTGLEPARNQQSRPRWEVPKKVLIPIILIVIGALISLGAHLGANGPEAWYTRAVRWVAARL
jgi:hypothetical protein